MPRLLLRRLAGLLLTLLVSSFLIYSALYLAPGDPVATWPASLGLAPGPGGGGRRRGRAGGGGRRPGGGVRPLRRPGHPRVGPPAAARLPYVDALRVQGQSPAAICGRHLLPNLGALVVAQATLTFGYALVDLAALSYLGLGADPATPDWGIMVAAGQADILGGRPQQSLCAGALIVVAVAACCILGERVTDRGGRRG